MITRRQPYVRSVVRAEIQTRDGRCVPLSWFGLDEGTRRGAAPVDLDAISHVRLLGDDGRVLLHGSPPAQGD